MNRILLVVLLGCMLWLSTAFKLRQEGQTTSEPICGVDEQTMNVYERAIQVGEVLASNLQVEDEDTRDTFIKDTVTEIIGSLELDDETITCLNIHATSQYDDDACETAEWAIGEAVSNGIETQTAGDYVDQFVPEVWPDFQGWEADCNFSLNIFEVETQLCGADGATVNAYNKAIIGAVDLANGIQFDSNTDYEEYVADNVAGVLVDLEMDDETFACLLAHAYMFWFFPCNSFRTLTGELVQLGIELQDAIDLAEQEVSGVSQNWDGPDSCDFNITEEFDSQGDFCDASEEIIRAYNEAFSNARTVTEGMGFDDEQGQEDFELDLISGSLGNLELEDEQLTCLLVHVGSEYMEPCNNTQWVIEEMLVNGVEAEQVAEWADSELQEMNEDYNGWEED